MSSNATRLQSEESFLDSHAPLAERQNVINPELHKKYNTKRGLRNDDGTGVLIGLTEIGEVHGYVMDEGEKTPVEGRLSYRGIDVEELTNGFQTDGRFGFEEVVYLLLFGVLPDRAELQAFQELLSSKRELPVGFAEDMILKAPSQDIMNKLARSTLASYSYDPNPEDLSVRNVLRQCVELIARFPTMTAYGFQAKRHYYDGESLFLHAPDPSLGTAENLLHMFRSNQSFSRLEAETLDLALVLHAEHGGGNNSAFTIHVVSSAATDTYSAVAAAVGSLKGAKHGGANGRVIRMMEDIKEHVKVWNDDDEVAAYLRRILRREAFDKSGLIYGLGHAVYTLSDPRAVLLKKKAKELAESKQFGDELELYNVIERVSPRVFREERQNQKNISPNVDFFSGFVYKMLNIPLELYTPIFAVSRIAGWCAHRIEEIVSGGRIIRPAYKNVLGHQAYVPMTER
ncbi:MAG TPA: citrate/2-methylcitrate synthase [Spirochaetia bacterium]|nr:citrate/2-methylcitrate synthase [Spirochaetia bacterium]